MEKSEYDELTSAIIGCAIEVHRILGPGLLESAYHECLLFELKLRGLHVYSKVEQPLMYKNQPHLRAYFIDLLVEDCVVLELKSVEQISDVHVSQILTYMKLGDYRVGLLLNFNVKMMKQGIHRYVNHF